LKTEGPGGGTAKTSKEQCEIKVCQGGKNMRKVRKKVEKVCGGGKKDEKCVFH
jgi:hypothetical protein